MMKPITKKQFNLLPVAGALLLVTGYFQSCKKDNAVINSAPVANITNYNGDFSGLNPDTVGTISKGLLAYWPLAGNGVDLSGNGNVGSIQSTTAVNGRSGDYGAALSFNGKNSFVKVKDTATLQNGMDDFSLNAWVNIESYKSGSSADIISAKSASTGWEWLINGDSGASAGTLGFLCQGATNAYNSNSSIGLYGWHMVTTTYKKATHTMNLYIDGSLDKKILNVTLPDSIFAGSNRIYLARQNPVKLVPANYFNGALNDIRLYNRVITAGEIKFLHNVSEAPYYGLAGFWPLNSKTKAQDASGVDHSYFGSVYGKQYNSGKPNHVVATTDRFGNPVGAYNFNVKTSNIIFNNSSTLFGGDASGISATVNIWVRLTTYNNAVLLSFNADGYSTPALANLSVDGTGLVSYRDPLGQTYPSIKSISQQKWHMVTMVYVVGSTGPVVKLYLDGVLDNTYSITDGTPTLSIGAIGYSEAGNMHLDGHLNDFRIYQRDLSDSEIQQLYRALD